MFDEEEENRKAQKKKNRLLTIFMVLFGVASVGLGVLAFNQKQKVEEKQITVEKIEEKNTALQKKVANLKTELKALEKENDTLTDVRTQLENEVATLEADVAEASKSVAALKKFKDRYYNLRSAIEKYQKRIASLKEDKKQLQTQNKVLQDSNMQLSDSIKSVAQLNRDLEDSVELGSIVRAYDYQITTYKTNLFGNEKTSDNASAIERVEGCFVIQENAIAEKGKRFVYYRVVKPNGNELTSEEDETTLFNLGNTKGHYASKKEIDYQGEAMEMCMEYRLSDDESLEEGTYTAELYMDQRQVGSTSFTLE